MTRKPFLAQSYLGSNEIDMSKRNLNLIIGGDLFMGLIKGIVLASQHPGPARVSDDT